MRVPLQSRVVTDPDGVRWRVSVRWTPWWPRRRLRTGGTAKDALDLGGFGADDSGIGIVILLLALTVGLSLLTLPVLLFLFEVALLIALAVPAALLLALAGITSWRIEVELEGATGEKRRVLEQHGGLIAADAAIFNLANQIQAGELRLQR